MLEIQQWLIVVAVISLVLLSGCADGADDSRLNLILISLDTTRADRLSIYGAERETTPNLDRLAAESVVFEDCLAQSTGTAPSHMSLFTGQYVHRHGLTNNTTGVRPAMTLASVLRDAGWKTAAFTGHGSLRAALGHDFGFESFESWTGEDSWPHTRNLREVLPRAEAWLETQAEEPFFLLVHAYDPHCPYWPPEPWRSEYAGWYSGSLDPRRLCGLAGYKPLFDQGLMGADERRYISDLYDGEIAASDEMLRGFLHRLRGNGTLERSILIFTSDHGEVLGAHDWVGHANIWEEEMRVPLFIRFPGSRWSGRIDEPVQLIDVLPTVLSAFGLRATSGVQGIDLMSRIRGEVGSLPEFRMRLSRIGETETVRFDRRHKIAFFGLTEESVSHPRLFDLESDPAEESNLYASPEGPALFRALLSRYWAWRLETKEEDKRFRGEALGDGDAVNREELRALGYVE